jgi:pimeloyl-ACP methyl ester carboxylesterase
VAYVKWLMDAVVPHFREAGSGPAVVCLHSSASSSAQWRSLMERLANRHRVIAADLYGYGQCPAWPEGRTLRLEDEVSLLEPVFRDAGNRFHLVGHSYGGAVALKAALGAPGRLLSLSIFEPVFFSFLLEEDPEQPAAREIISLGEDTSAAVDRGEPEKSAERFVDYWMGPGAWAGTPEKRRAAITPTMRKVKAEWRALFTEQTPLRALSTLSVDTLFLSGSMSPLASRTVSRLIAQTLPRVTTRVLEGVGHMGPITHPDAVNNAIEAHLDHVGVESMSRRTAS